MFTKVRTLALATAIMALPMAGAVAATAGGDNPGGNTSEEGNTAVKNNQQAQVVMPSAGYTEGSQKDVSGSNIPTASPKVTAPNSSGGGTEANGTVIPPHGNLGGGNK